MAYQVSGGGNFASMPAMNSYGAVIEGNFHNSYGPYVDPELKRKPHRRSAVNKRGRRRSDFYAIAVP